MDEEKVYTPEVIVDTPLPGETAGQVLTTVEPSDKTTGSFGQSEMRENPPPAKKIATELLSEKINTRTQKIIAEFQFTPSGALQIGDYKTGQSGDIRISPNGIVARNKFGDNTFALDGDSGDAVFSGTIQTGALVAGKMLVGDGSIEIDGTVVRMLFYDTAGVPTIVIGTVS